MMVISLPRVRHEQGQTRAAEPSAGTIESSAGRLRLTVFDGFPEIERRWRALQAAGVCVEAQSFERVECWARLVSRPEGAMPAIVCGETQAGTPQFIWPLEVYETGGMRALRWIGSEQANYAMGLHTLEFARSVTAADMKTLLVEAAQLIGGVSAAFLDKQPYEWDGVANPFTLLPHRESANAGHSILLDADFDNLYRNRFSGKSRNTLRRKERRLRDEGPVEIGWAGSAEERGALLDEFFRQKAQQFVRQGIRDAFADPRRRAFYHELAARPSGREGALEIASLKANGNVAAISCGFFFKDKFTLLLTSIDDGPVSKNSPGSLLLHFLIEDCCRKGLNFLDMGAGDARPKDDWCDVRTPLFETSIAFDERGYLLTVPRIAQSAGKRFIKTRPRLWALAQAVRRVLYGKRTGTYKAGEPNLNPSG